MATCVKGGAHYTLAHTDKHRMRMSRREPSTHLSEEPCCRVVQNCVERCRLIDDIPHLCGITRRRGVDMSTFDPIAQSYVLYVILADWLMTKESARLPSPTRI